MTNRTIDSKTTALCLFVVLCFLTLEATADENAQRSKRAQGLRWMISPNQKYWKIGVKVHSDRLQTSKKMNKYRVTKCKITEIIFISTSPLNTVLYKGISQWLRKWTTQWPLRKQQPMIQHDVIIDNQYEISWFRFSLIKKLGETRASMSGFKKKIKDIDVHLLQSK